MSACKASEKQFSIYAVSRPRTALLLQARCDPRFLPRRAQRGAAFLPAPLLFKPQGNPRPVWTPDAYEGFAALFARFRAQGGRVCVISHSERDVIERHYRELFGFLPDLIFGWDEPEQRRKPHPYPLQETMRRLNLRPEEILLVDDLAPGFSMAAACGVPSAYAGWSHTSPAVGARVRPQADYAFDTVEELAAFLGCAEV